MKLGLFFAALLPLTACGDGPATQSGPTTTVDHVAALADHEIPDLAAQLVPIAGHSYVDPPAAEVDRSLSVIHENEQRIGVPDFFAAVSFHGVVADDQTQNQSRTASGGNEVGYLFLTEFRYSPPAGLEDDPTYFSSLYDKAMADPSRIEMSGISVFKFIDPSSPDSRYIYLWIRHGVQGQFDGADDASMETWLSRYLASPALSQNESEELAKRLISVAGFVYVNDPEHEVLAGVIVNAFGQAPFSIHKVADSSGAIGALSLIELTRPMSADQAAEALFAAGGVRLASADHQVIAGVPVSVFQVTEADHMYVWVTGTTVGMFGADVEPASKTFVEHLLQGWAANGLT